MPSLSVPPFEVAYAPGYSTSIIHDGEVTQKRSPEKAISGMGDPRAMVTIEMSDLVDDNKSARSLEHEVKSM